MRELTLNNTGLDEIKMTPEQLLIFVPLTFVAGNWYISSIALISVFIFMTFRYLRFKDHEIIFPEIIPWLLILLWGIYVMYITPKPEVAVKYYTATLLIPFLIFVLFNNLRLTERVLNSFINIMLLSGVIISCYSIYLFYSFGMRDELRIPSFWNDFNMTSFYLMILFMFNLSFIINSKSTRKKIIYYASLILILMGIYLTKTRGVWLAIVISILIFFIKRPRIIIPAIIFIGLISLFFMDIIQDRFLSIMYFEQDKSSLGRLQAWYSTILIIIKNPWFGYGFDTYYLYRDDVMTNFIVDVPHPHNTYLRAIQEMGIIGAALYFYLILKALYFSFNFGKYVKNPVNKKYLDAAQLTLVGLIVAFNFEPYLSLFGVTTISIWIVVAMTFRIRKDALNFKTPKPAPVVK